MPEGDNIFRAARTLQQALAGHVVKRIETPLAHLARVDYDTPVAGRTVERVEPAGKWMRMYFSGDLVLVTHMLMSGSWHIYRTGERWHMPRSKMRVVISTAEWQAVAFNVPIAEFHTARSLERSEQVPRLGPDILSGDFTIETGIERIATCARETPEAEVGVTLLNQRILAGLGNVYKSEVAFSARVNPFRAIRTLSRSEIERVVEIAYRYMKANVADGKSDGILTYTGSRRTTHAMDREERLWVYKREGQECRRCGATVLMRKQGTQARVTFWCPECQPFVQ